jgi:hypothetical protein
MILGLLILAITGGCSVGAGSHARSTALPAAVLGGGAAATSAATALPAPQDLYLQLAAINRPLWGWQLLSFRAVVESLAARLEIHHVARADLGRTLVWDQERSAYVASLRTDAPAGAVRVVLYTIDPALDRPAIPLAEIGVVDMYPQNTTIGGPVSVPTMHYVVSAAGPNPMVYADFSAVDGEPGCACATVAGWVTDVLTRVDFSARYSFDEDGVRFTATAHLASQPGVFQFDATMEESLLHSEARFAVQDDSLETRGMLLDDDDGTSGGTFTVRVNGRPFTDSNADLTTVIGPQGRSLTSIERLTVRQLYVLTYGLLLNVELPTYLTFNCGC